MLERGCSGLPSWYWSMMGWTMTLCLLIVRMELVATLTQFSARGQLVRRRQKDGEENGREKKRREKRTSFKSERLARDQHDIGRLLMALHMILAIIHRRSPRIPLRT